MVSPLARSRADIVGSRSGDFTVEHRDGQHPYRRAIFAGRAPAAAGLPHVWCPT